MHHYEYGIVRAFDELGETNYRRKETLQRLQPRMINHFVAEQVCVEFVNIETAAHRRYQWFNFSQRGFGYYVFQLPRSKTVFRKDSM